VLSGIDGATTMAVISFPGEYGQDGAAGAKIAAEALGIEIVYDGEAAVVPGSDQTPVITELVNADPDIVWATINPGTLAEIFGGAYAQGLRALWSGNSPTFNYQLLATELGAAFDELYYHTTYTQLWQSDDTPGMTEMVEGMREKRPNAPLSDVYIVSWTEGYATQAVLELAAAKGDMTRAGVVAAFNEVEVDMKGLAPTSAGSASRTTSSCASRTTTTWCSTTSRRTPRCPTRVPVPASSSSKVRTSAPSPSRSCSKRPASSADPNVSAP